MLAVDRKVEPSLKASIDASLFEMKIEISKGVSDVFANLNRTEDCRFSPNGNVLAIAGFETDLLHLFKVEFRREANQLILSLISEQTISHPSLANPHGVDFVDENTLVVANREGGVSVLGLPNDMFQGGAVEVESLLHCRKVNFFQKMRSPGSVAVTNISRFSYDIAVCLNYQHKLARLRVYRNGHMHFPVSGRIVLERGLNIPDGIAICPVTGRVAIANHEEQMVRIYGSLSSMKKGMEPVGRLAGIAYPHGLRFIDCGRGLLLADAGAPLVHLWRSLPDEWNDLRVPAASFKIMSDDVFCSGQHNLQEGGPKGLDVHPSGEFLVVTCEKKALIALSVSDLLSSSD